MMGVHFADASVHCCLQCIMTARKVGGREGEKREGGREGGGEGRTVSY